MLDSFGETLRGLRQQRGLSLAALANRTGYGKSHLGNIETGAARPTLGVAEHCDAALGCAPLLAVLVSLEKGDPMMRRALLGGGIGAAVGGLTAGVADGTAAVAAVLSAGLQNAATGDVDWDDLAASFARRHVLAPSPAFADELAAHLQVARVAVAGGDRAAARGAALLALTYGLWIGDTGRIPTAHSLYATAAALADKSGHRATRALVRARAANRGAYEGWTAAQVTDQVTEALIISDTGQAAVEAHAARVHLFALTGDLSAGRNALGRMLVAAERMPEATGPSTAQRVASFRAYLECRVGSIRDAEKAWATAAQQLAGVPLWYADAAIYWGRALIKAGNVEEGATVALEAIQALPAAAPRVLGVGVRDLLAAAGPDARGDALAVLRGYAVTGPAPWVTIR